MKKRGAIIFTSFILIFIIGISLQLDHYVANALFPVCNEGSWGMQKQQCTCRGVVYNAAPNVHDYYKDVCIGIITKNQNGNP